MSGVSKTGRKAKTLIIEDDGESAAVDEANPFSFKEFVKSKTRPVIGDGDLSQEVKLCAGRTPEADDMLTLHPDYQETFFKDPTVTHDLLDEDDEDDDEDEEWSGSYHPSVIEQSHMDTSLGSLYDDTYPDPFEEWRLTERVPPPAKGKAANGAADDSMADLLHCQSLRIDYQALQQENSHLKRRVQELMEHSQSQAEKVEELQRKLEEKILEEQKEAQDLESMVQQVEANLQMMTKRASKAESHVTKLKQEVALLQVQLNTYKMENEALRRGETAGMIAVKQNASLALENLNTAVSGARSSIKQLVSGAEALNLVADLLKSIDKIAEVHEDVP